LADEEEIQDKSKQHKITLVFEMNEHR